MAPRADRAVPGATRGLSTRGRCLLAGGIAAVACAVILDERDLVAIGVVAVLLPVLAVLSTALRRPQVRVQHRVTPSRLQPGTRAAVVLTVTNTGRSRTHTLDLTQPAVPGLLPGHRTLVPPIARGTGVDLPLTFVAQRRGRYPLGSAVLRVHDPFDLWEEHRRLPGGTDVVVVPTLVHLTGLPRGSGSRSAASGRALVGTSGGDPDVGVRPYRTGDDLRTVHWRASARLEEDLVVRLEEPVSHGGAALLVDHRAGRHPDDSRTGGLELALSLTASIGLHLLEQDVELTVSDHRGTPVASGHDIAETLLTALADVQPDPDPTFSPQVPHRAGVILAVVGLLDEAEAARLVAVRHRGVNALAFVVEPGEVPVPPETARAAAAAADRLRSAGWRVVPVTRGADLAASWRQACSPTTAAVIGR